jgi:hypothetical protein
MHMVGAQPTQIGAHGLLPTTIPLTIVVSAGRDFGRVFIFFSIIVSIDTLYCDLVQLSAQNSIQKRRPEPQSFDQFPSSSLHAPYARQS